MTSYIREDGARLALGNDAVEGVLDLSGRSSHLSEMTNKLTGRRFTFGGGDDCSLRLSTATERIEIPEWAFRLGSVDPVGPRDEEGYQQGLYADGIDMGDWLRVSALNEYPVGAVGYTTAVYPGYAWYRHQFELPAGARAQPISLLLGGCDDQDWLAYWVYVNGILVGSAEPGVQRWHPTPRFDTHPGEAAYEAWRFGQRNTLAVQVRGLDRRRPGMVESNLERYSVGTPLYEQCILVGEPYRDISTFSLRSYERDERPERSELSLHLTDGTDVLLDVRYWADSDDPVLYKQVHMCNGRDQPLLLLDVDVHRLVSTADISDGGWGEICTVGGELFCGVCHPAGIVQGEPGSVRLRLFPGRILSPAERYDSKIAILGVGPEGDAAQSFLRYLEQRSPRRREIRSLYSPYGIYDFAGSVPTEVTERLLLDNLDDVARLQARGIVFDYYAIDTGWNNPTGDLTDFNPATFPTGPSAVFARIAQLGMKPGLWASPSFGPAAFRPGASIPALESCKTRSTHLGDEDTDEASPVDSPAFCLAAEPYRSMLHAALLHHVRHNDVRCFKFDGHQLHCNNPDHGHLAATYSVEPIMDALIETIIDVRAACDDVMVMWYWGVRSPWWLLYGDTLYEHGIHMEAATPADAPSIKMRQSVTVSLDQGADYAWDRVPLPSQDSLGVWVSDTRWGSWMKTEGWQDAWVMDVARGSMLLQLWGDITLFEEHDLDFLTRMSAWISERGYLLTQTHRILSHPWSGEPYGYAHMHDDQGMIAVHNPGFVDRTVSLHLGHDTPPLPDNAGRYRVLCVYPFQGSPVLSMAKGYAAGDTLNIHLNPFQVTMLQLDPITAEEAPPPSPRRPTTRHGRALTCALDDVGREPMSLVSIDAVDPVIRRLVRRAITGRAQYIDTEASFRQSLAYSDPRDRLLEYRRLVGHIDVPAREAESLLLLTVQTSRDGVFWHHRSLQDIISVHASGDGRALDLDMTPRRWHEQAGAWSWMTFQRTLAAASRPARLTLDVQCCLPVSVATTWSAWLIER